MHVRVRGFECVHYIIEKSQSEMLSEYTFTFCDCRNFTLTDQTEYKMFTIQYVTDYSLKNKIFSCNDVNELKHISTSLHTSGVMLNSSWLKPAVKS